MPRPRLTEEQCAARRDQILKAAHDILLDEGFRGISTRAIARRLGISPMALYRYFPSRDAIIQALQERQRQRMQRRLGSLVRRAETEDAGTVFRAWLDHHQRLSRENPRVFRFLWVNQLEDAETREERAVRVSANLQHVARLMEIGMQRGDFVTRDPMTAAATAVSIALGPMLMYHNGNVANQALCEQMTRDAAEAALNYLRGRSEPTVLTNERNAACVLSDA